MLVACLGDVQSMSVGDCSKKPQALSSATKGGQSGGQKCPPRKRGYSTKRLNKIVFTVAFIEGLKPGLKRQRFYDIKSQGLMLEVMTSGAKIFRFRKKVNQKQQWETIGDFPSVSLDDARRKSIGFSNDLVEGTDFTRVRKDIKEEWTLRELSLRYFEVHADQNCKTAREMKQDFERWFLIFLDRPLSSFETHDIQMQLMRLNAGGHPARAARTSTGVFKGRSFSTCST